MKIVRIVGLLAVIAGPSDAQPFSQSMAECAGLISAGRAWVEQAENADRLLQIETLWLSAAYVQAQSEGTTEPRAVVAQIFEAKRAEWVAKGRTAVFSPHYKDWSDYCRAFGRDQGIKLERD